MVLSITSKQQMLATIAARASTPPERFQAGRMLSNDHDPIENYRVATRKKRLSHLLEVKDEAALTRLFGRLECIDL